MNDNPVLQHIDELVNEEHALLDRAAEQPLSADDRTRLEAIEVQLDRYYDLLRQRRARREFGQDEADTHVRSAETVERYLQ
jgi:hypothetical protein